MGAVQHRVPAVIETWYRQLTHCHRNRRGSSCGSAAAAWTAEPGRPAVADGGNETGGVTKQVESGRRAYRRTETPDHFEFRSTAALTWTDALVTADNRALCELGWQHLSRNGRGTRTARGGRPGGKVVQPRTLHTGTRFQRTSRDAERRAALTG